ncbi:4422_t:CDS:2, partial [Ambispora gerdemannii]
YTATALAGSTRKISRMTRVSTISNMNNIEQHDQYSSNGFTESKVVSTKGRPSGVTNRQGTNSIRRDSSRFEDEFRKLKSDGPQFSELDLIKYRKQLDEDREARLSTTGLATSSKKKNPSSTPSRSGSPYRDHRQRYSSEESGEIREEENNDERGSSQNQREEHESKRKRHSKEKHHHSRQKRKYSESEADDNDKHSHHSHKRRSRHKVRHDVKRRSSGSEEEESDDEKPRKRHHHHHGRHSHKKPHLKQKIQAEEQHRGDTPVRLSEYLKHGSSSSDE